MKMDKKGALWVWVTVFGILLALAFFFMSQLDVDVGLKEKGEWQIDFLKDVYLPTETELLKVDLAAKEAGLKVALELANNGGYTKTSPCGAVGGINLWNEKEKLCLPKISDSFTILFNKHLTIILPDNNYSSVNYENSYIFARGKEVEISSSRNNFKRYIYDNSFSVNIGYNFEEYEQVMLKAIELVKTCAGNQTLITCLKEEREDSWNDISCNGDNFEDEKKVRFCVSSLYDTEVNYKFALDFSTAVSAMTGPLVATTTPPVTNPPQTPTT